MPRSSAATATTAEEIVHFAKHQRVQRVTCRCGAMVDVDELSQARHLAGQYEDGPTCRAATDEVRATAAAWLARNEDAEDSNDPTQ